MTTNSGVFWIGSSDAEIARARALLRTLSQPGVLDELGFLVLLGAFSDRLYPAINTIMTRARYMVFVPAIMRHIEEKRLARTRAADAVARDLQYQLCQALSATDPSDLGIIGRQAGRDIARPPSNVYWTAFAELGVATSRVSESTYYEQLSVGSRSGSHIADDDGNLHDMESDEFWDPEYRTPGVLKPDGSFPAGTSFRLTYQEARQLQERYERLRPDGGTSLLAHLITLGEKRAKVVADSPAPWDIPDLPAVLQRITEHARLLSLLARGAQLQYHALLFEKKRIADTGTLQAFEAWWARCRRDLAEWDLRDFQTLRFVATGQKAGDVTFLSEWRDAVCRGRTARSAYLDGEARDILKRRERDVRGPKGRLRSPFHLREWRAPDEYKPEDVFGLSFRHQTALRFAQDITDGLRSARP